MSGRTRHDAAAPDTQAAIKDPDEWVTGDEPWTAAQRSYLRTLSREAGEEAPESLSKADAAKLIEELQERTGRTTSKASQSDVSTNSGRVRPREQRSGPPRTSR